MTKILGVGLFVLALWWMADTRGSQWFGEEDGALSGAQRTSERVQAAHDESQERLDRLLAD